MYAGYILCDYVFSYCFSMKGKKKQLHCLLAAADLKTKKKRKAGTQDQRRDSFMQNSLRQIMLGLREIT